MKRRHFSKLVAGSIALSPIHIVRKYKGNINRIGMSTVHFRDRFKTTSVVNSSYAGSYMKLTEIPGYFADRFHLHNVELWSKHFESMGSAYLRELRRKIKKSRSTLINIQCDESYQLGDPDPEKREEGLKLALQWVDVAAQVGSAAIRFNPGNGEIDHTVNALRIINDACKKSGLVLMTENHFGMEMDPEIHIKITKQVGKNMYTLPDFGNYPDDSRYSSLEKIMPYAYQVSAKTIAFNTEGEHVSFDFDRCMKIAESSGFRGIYSVEQWSREPSLSTDEEMADWMIEKVKQHC